MSENKYFKFLNDIDVYFGKQLNSHAFQDDYAYENLQGTEF